MSNGSGAVAAVVAAIAGLILVAVLTGWVLIWLQFTGAGISAEDALGATSLGEVIRIGGSHLFWFFWLGVGAVGIAWLVDRRGTVLGHAVAATLLAGIGIVIAIFVFEASESARAIAIASTAAAVVAASLVAVATTENFVHRWLLGHRRVVPLAFVVLTIACALSLLIMGEDALAVGAVVIGGVLSGLIALAVWPPRRHTETARLPQARGLLRWIRAEALSLWQWIRTGLQAAGIAVRSGAALVGVLVLAGLLWIALGNWPVPVLVLVAAALVTVLMALLRWRDTIQLYAVFVFMAVLVFGFALTALQTFLEPDLRPVAILEKSGKTQVGFYVAERGGAVYIGSVRFCRRNPSTLELKAGSAVGDSGEVTRVSNSDVQRMTTGRGTKLRNVFTRAQVLLNGLREEAGLEPEPVRKPCLDEGVLDLKPRPSQPVEARLAAKLAARFRPILKFDTSERWRPLNVDLLLVEGRDGHRLHRICANSGSCNPLRRVRDLARSSEDGYIDFEGDHLGGDDFRTPNLTECRNPETSRLLDCDAAPASAIYYHATAANDRIYIDYWWFLRYNHFLRYNAKRLCSSKLLRSVGGVCSEHEGDWEGVTAVTAPGDPDRLEFVSYAQHTGVVRRPLDRLRRDGQRPVVYLADGSHAAYARDCPHNCDQESKLLFKDLPEDNTDGMRAWGRNGEEACARPRPCLLSLPLTSWGAFKGLWGSRKCTSGRRRFCQLAKAPRTPSAQQRYRYPWCYSLDERKLACDGRPAMTNSQLRRWLSQGGEQ